VAGAAGLICVEFDMCHWLRTMQLWTSAWQGREFYAKSEHGEGVKTSQFLQTSFLNGLLLLTAYGFHPICCSRKGIGLPLRIPHVPWNNFGNNVG